ncbi:MAG: type I-G CRISPR-associated RAMP protein Csb1/Cas7g [Candidatus Nanopelagicales bacterium]
MSSALKEAVYRHVIEPDTAGLVIETELAPLGGRSTAVAPPTYARESGDRSKEPNFAETENAFVPVKDDEGWHREIRRDDQGPVLAKRVLIDSVASQSGRAETALWNIQEALGLALPGITITGEYDGDPVTEEERQLAETLKTTISTWTAPHRQADAWVRFAETETGQQVWQEQAPESVRNIITSTSAATGKSLYSNFPNSAVFGYWLSTGTAARHKLPRAYSSEVVGYGAQPVTTGTTKLDAAGGTSEKCKVKVADGQLAIGSGSKPSTVGFGQVPSRPVTTGYVCELILQQSSLSLAVLRSLTFQDQKVKDAALTVLTLLGMLGHFLAGRDGFLRSSCSLVAVTERWGWMRRGQLHPEPLAVGGVDELKDALLEAIGDAEALGLFFAEPIRLRFSEAETTLIKHRIKIETDKQTSDD